MSQQINLLNPSLIKQKDFLNANTIVLTLGILLALMTAYYNYAQKQLSLITVQRGQVAQELAAIQATLQQTALLHTPHALNKALLEQITQLEHKESMQQQILQTVKLSSATPEKGYAALMSAFAKQSIEGLWLTSFSIDSRTEQLNINGRTLQAELVPEYISRLGTEPALQGKLFSALNMNLPKPDATASSTPATTVVPANNAAQVLKNGQAIIPTNTTTATANNTPNFIEFSLQSIEDKSLAETSSTNTKVNANSEVKVSQVGEKS